jgi:hypothetical protein
MNPQLVQGSSTVHNFTVTSKLQIIKINLYVASVLRNFFYIIEILKASQERSIVKTL